MKRRIIAVAGNMGVGKSTLVQFLCSQFNGHAFYEAESENPYLPLFFKNMNRWAFHSQMFFLIEKLKSLQEISKKSGLIVLDRTIYEDAEIFAKGLYNENKITKTDFDLYWDFYKIACQNILKPDILIYLTCSLDTLQDRINNRARNYEKKVPVSYLKRIQSDYDRWVASVDFCEVVTIKTDDLNYISDDVHKQNTINRLAKYLNH